MAIEREALPEQPNPLGLDCVFPGEGVHSEAVAELALRLQVLGYEGDYSFEVFNDDYQQLPLELGRPVLPVSSASSASCAPNGLLRQIRGLARALC